MTQLTLWPELEERDARRQEVYVEAFFWYLLHDGQAELGVIEQDARVYAREVVP